MAELSNDSGVTEQGVGGASTVGGSAINSRERRVEKADIPAEVRSWLEKGKAKQRSSFIVNMAPNGDFLSKERGRQAFNDSIVDKSWKPDRTENLFAKLFKTGPIEVKIDESKVIHPMVTALLADLRREFPGLNISLRGRFTNKSDASAPELFLKFEIKDKDSAVFAVPNAIGSGDGIAREKAISLKQAFVDARIESARKLGLPDDADPQWRKREEKLAEKATEFLQELDKALSRPLSGEVVVSDCIKLCQVDDRFSKYEINPFFVLKYAPALAFSLYVCANYNGIGAWVTTALFDAIYLLVTVSFGIETPFKPADPLNTIQSPSIRKLIEEIRRRGLVPKLKQSREGYEHLDMHNMYVYDLEARIK